MFKETGIGWWLAATIITGILGIVAVPYFKHLDTENEKSELEKYQLRIHDGLAPVLQLLVELSEATDRELQKRTLARLLTTCLTAASRTSDSSRVRASYYRAYPRFGSKKERLDPFGSLGRNDTAQSVFEKGTKAGNEVFRRLLDNVTTFVPDISKLEKGELPGWNMTKKRPYKTFISVPVRGKSDLYGMLTVDGPEVGDLSEYDEMFVRCIGLIYASGVALVAPE